MVRVQSSEFNQTIRERDLNQCTVCLRSSLDLQIHHLKAVSDYPELQHDEDNVVTLCGDCHKEFHKLYTNKFFSEVDFEEYQTEKRLILVLLMSLSTQTKIYSVDFSSTNFFWDSNIVQLYNEVSTVLWEAFKGSYSGMPAHELVVNHFFDDFKRRLLTYAQTLMDIEEQLGSDVFDELLKENGMNAKGLVLSIIESTDHNDGWGLQGNWCYKGTDATRYMNGKGL